MYGWFPHDLYGFIDYEKIQGDPGQPHQLRIGVQIQKYIPGTITYGGHVATPSAAYFSPIFRLYLSALLCLGFFMPGKSYFFFLFY